MFALALREMLIVLGALGVIWFVWSRIRKIGRRDARKESVKESLDSIDEIIELAKEIPSINPEKLSAAREKLKKIMKEGEK